MKKLLVLALLLITSSAWAQGNPQCPNRSAGDSTNACANTRFVTGAISTNIPYNYVSAALCDGTTNDQPAIQAAFTASGLSGKNIILPPGICKINSALTATGTKSFDIIGQGTNATTILSTFATGDVLTYNVTSGSIRHLKLDSSVVRTSGATIKLVPNTAAVFDVVIDHPYIGIHNTGIVNSIIATRIGRTGFTSRAVSANSGGIFNEGGQLQISTTVISGATVTPANMPEYGIRNHGEVDISTSYIFLVNKGIWTPPAITQGGIMGMADTWIDSVLDSGVNIDGSSGSTELETMISTSWITCGYSATTCTAAIYLGVGVKYVTIGNNLLVAYNNGVGQGVWMNQNASSIATNIHGNQIGLAGGLGFQSGIFTAANLTGWNVTGNGFKGNTTAVTISAGNDDYVVSSNNLVGNGTTITNLSAAAANGKLGLNTGVNIIAAGVCAGVATRDTEGRITAC